MNRNEETNFSDIARVDIQRSIFTREYNLKTSFNAGELVPFLVDEVLPGDTFTADTSLVIRTTSPMIKPVMDNLFLDTYYFGVPNRLVWEHWKEFMGENNEGPWTQTTEYIVPQTTAPSTGWAEHTIADYMTIPTKVPNIAVSSLYFRAYALIWNEFFRDENLQNPTDVPKDDSNTVGVNTGVLETDACKGGLCLPVNKVSDYFTKALPQPQKGAEVSIPLGIDAPVYTQYKATDYDSTVPLIYRNTATGQQLTGMNKMWLYDGGAYAGTNEGNNNNPVNIQPQNLWTDLTQASAASINNLRQAFATQRLLERDARGGRVIA